MSHEQGRGGQPKLKGDLLYEKLIYSTKSSGCSTKINFTLQNSVMLYEKFILLYKREIFKNPLRSNLLPSKHR